MKRDRYTLAEARFVAYEEDRRRSAARKVDPTWDGMEPEGTSLRAAQEFREAVLLLGCAIVESPVGTWLRRLVARLSR